MELNTSLHLFLTNPENAWLVYGVAIFFMLDGLLLIFFKDKFVRAKDKVQGKTRGQKKLTLILSIIGYCSWVTGFLIAGYAFKFSQL
jgi:hypothetical protein